MHTHPCMRIYYLMVRYILYNYVCIHDILWTSTFIAVRSMRMQTYTYVYIYIYTYICMYIIYISKQIICLQMTNYISVCYDRACNNPSYVYTYTNSTNKYLNINCIHSYIYIHIHIYIVSTFCKGFGRRARLRSKGEELQSYVYWYIYI